MKKLFSSCLLITSIVLLGCAGVPKEMYIPYSEGLPEGQQWKCNPAFGDVNRDGLLDLAAIARKGNGAHVWINQGDGTWSEASDGLLLQSSCGGGSDFGDINNDGILDLAIGDHCKGLYVYKGDGTGKWISASRGLPKFQADDVALGDFNRDGNLDLVACSSNDKGIRVFMGNGKGDWNEASSSGLPASDDCHEITLGDFNHDSYLDIAATMINQPRAWLSTGKGTWKESSYGFPKQPWGGQYWGIASGDVNNDGHLDIALGRIVKGPEIYLGDGKGVWRPALNGLSAVQSGWGVTLGDIDKDGRIDLLVSGKKSLKEHGNTHGVFFFKGDGKGNWKFIADSGLPQKGMFQSWGLTLADLDNDGNLEIAGCFGTGSSRPPPFLIESGKHKEFLTRKEFSGPRGSVRVWKLDRIK